MLKENRKFFIITCIITIFPIFLGLFLWNRLPDQISTHFEYNGTPNGYGSKLFAVIGIYVFCLCMHIFCAVVTSSDPKRKNISPKIYRLILCICPVVSLWCAALIYGNALHYPLHRNNWDYTHRLAGKLWMIGGILIILFGFQTIIPPMPAALIIMLIVTIIPAIASYLYYRKHSENHA